MKKMTIIIALLLAVLSATSTIAQNRIGVVGGLNIANVKDRDLAPNKSLNTRSLYGAGGVLELGLSNSVSLSLEPMFLKKGTTLEIQGFDVAEAHFGWSYIEIPLFLKVDLSGSSVRPYIMGGPTLGILLNSRVQVDLSGIELADRDADAISKGADFSVGMGAGVSFAVGNKSIFVEGRYVLGLRDIIDDGTLEILGEAAEITGKGKTRGIQLMIGMTFPLGSGQ